LVTAFDLGKTSAAPLPQCGQVTWRG